MTTDNLEIKLALSPFTATLGSHTDYIENMMRSELGKLKVTSKQSGWKVSRLGIKSKEGHEVELPLANPMWILLRFGMMLMEVAGKGEMDIESTLPKHCQDWFNQLVKHRKEATPAPEVPPTA